MRSTGTLGTALGAGALLIALVGCSSSTPVGAQSGPTLTTVPSSSAPASEEPEFDSPVPPEGEEVPAEKITASVPEGTPTTVWTEEDGTVLGAIGQEGGCTRASLEITEQTAQAVKVVLVETTPADQQVCTMDIRYPPLTAKLDAPLGDRRVELSTRQVTE
ncbi:hypothetical protein [Saccharothrix longispora]|uniref:hypothetical protein n=1 Tax=Saccharothrix longispora TaxID=33920 RepID=UPI0028FD9BE5|nr:hypothetical protein [Saccharothrix longispora]MBY8849899.1 hypothetical protein [Saccharothrix sp. MB29]MDU0291444.1 hypothetical protein [Saccharothrix longispora]